MNALENIKNSLIDRILATNNENLLTAINNIFASTQQIDELVAVSSEQIEMLSMSDNDIKMGNVVSEEDLDKRDSEWLA